MGQMGAQAVFEHVVVCENPKVNWDKFRVCESFYLFAPFSLDPRWYLLGETKPRLGSPVDNNNSKNTVRLMVKIALSISCQSGITLFHLFVV